MKEMANSELLFLQELEPVSSDVENRELMTTDDIDREIRLVELEYKREELESRKQDRKQRGRFSIWIFGFMGIYMILVLAGLYFVGCGVLSLSDTVLVALLTTTTADVIGIFIIVAKYLFHKVD